MLDSKKFANAFIWAAEMRSKKKKKRKTKSVWQKSWQEDQRALEITASGMGSPSQHWAVARFFVAARGGVPAVPFRRSGRRSGGLFPPLHEARSGCRHVAVVGTTLQTIGGATRVVGEGAS